MEESRLCNKGVIIPGESMSISSITTVTGTQENAANLLKVREIAHLQQFILFLYYIL